MARFYHTLSGLPTLSTSGLHAYREIPGGDAGRFFERQPERLRCQRCVLKGQACTVWRSGAP
jgi:hypothetical protein